MSQATDNPLAMKILLKHKNRWIFSIAHFEKTSDLNSLKLALSSKRTDDVISNAGTI